MSKLVRNEREITGAVGVAEDVGYNNVSSGLEASNVQDAIDEISANLTVRDISSDLTVVTGMLKSAYRYGNVVSICVRYDYKDSATLITGLPTPVGTVEIDCVTYNVNGAMNSGMFSIQSNGTLSYNNFYNQGGNAAKIVTITYIAND